MHEYLNYLRPELKLLLALCRIEFSEEQKKYISVLIHEVNDWEYFVKMSNEHGIIALCWSNIITSGNERLIPGETLDLMHKSYLNSLSRNTKIYALLQEVLEIASRNNIKVILLKGLALEKTIYGNKGLRQMSDLDILVKENDVIKFRKILLKSNFKSEPLISPLFELINPKIGKHLPELYKDGLSIEIHYYLSGLEDTSLHEIFTSSPIIKEGNKTISLPPLKIHSEYLLNHLVNHEKEGVSQLKFYLDLITINDILDNLKEENLSKEQINHFKEGLPYSYYSAFERIFEDKLRIQKKGLDPSGISEQQSSFVSFLNKPKQLTFYREKKKVLRILSELNPFWKKAIFVIGYTFPSPAYMKYHYEKKNFGSLLHLYIKRWVCMIKRILH